MANETAIGWCDLSWNPVHGCSKVSPGCARCYAETLSLQRGHTTKPWTPENALYSLMHGKVLAESVVADLEARGWVGKTTFVTEDGCQILEERTDFRRSE
jgi:hypothetical protein